MGITSEINWPAGLPGVIREGHSTQHGNTLQRTQLESGRARQRQRFTSVPSVQQCSWIFSENEAVAFEAWYRDALHDGAEWFNMLSRTPMGQETQLVCRFTGIYSGPDLVGGDMWKVAAPLEIFERPLMPAGWGLMPEYLLRADVFDIAVNQRWPAA